ncbi:MAG: RNA-directed DNA polymerase [Synergistota bacterium]|nr:RNA-directed DNA polymerase [Synergistota bacterium]
MNSVASDPQKTRRTILDLSADEASGFFLKEESYCSLELPPYIVFANLLKKVDAFLYGKNLRGFSNRPRDCDGVNYTILHNKDGKYTWRPFQLIHPALYVSLVHQITEEAHWCTILERFKVFSQNKRIQCLSLPIQSLSKKKDKAAQILHWWQEIEQRSIELSLEYEYLFETDVSDCYCSIYTHSIAWALHTKSQAKNNRHDNSFIGNVIDNHIQDMCLGQTNGIPQGSVLMDFVAEIILGFADSELSKKIEGFEDYFILRYRDDYRIFVNNPQIGEQILKLLTEVMIDLGLKLNPSKTRLTNSVIENSIKADKLNWIAAKQYDKNVQKHLLIIHGHSHKFPNSGTLAIGLADFQKRISQLQKYNKPLLPLISIIVDIAYRNPRTYPVCVAIISKLLFFLNNEDEKTEVLTKIQNKFSKIPNTGHMQIWLQRISLALNKDITYDESICRLVAGEDLQIWNNSWISHNALKRELNAKQIIDSKKIKKLKPIIPVSEIELFKGYLYD